MEIGRRDLLKSSVGVAVGMGVASQSVRATQAGSGDLQAEQGKYLKKHAVRRQSIYDMMIPIFVPPDNEDYAGKFAESLAPSASSLLPGIAGSAADLKETLEWYNDIVDSNGVRSVAQQGALISVKEPRGENGAGLEGAREELEDLKQAASAVENAASEYEESPSKENRNALVEALKQEHQRAAIIFWINSWSKITPSNYQQLFGGDVEEAAEQIRDNAEAASEIITATREVTSTQATILEQGGVFRIPDLVVTYGEQIDEVRQNVPSYGFSQYAGDSLNIRIQNEEEEDLSVTWVNTNSEGELVEYELKEKSANADVMITESTVEEIRESDNPSTKLSKAWENDELTFQGNGFVNGIKYNHTDLIAGHNRRSPVG